MLKEIHLAGRVEGAVRQLLRRFRRCLGSPSSAKRRLRLQEPNLATLEKSHYER